MDDAEISSFIASLSDQGYLDFDPDFAVTGERMDTSTFRDRVRNYLAEKAYLARTGEDARPSGAPRIFTVGLAESDARRSHVEDRMSRALADTDPGTYRQRSRRSAAIQELVPLVLDRVKTNTNVAFITASELNRLMEDYQQARKEGFSDIDLDWLPLSAYIGKIAPEGKKPLRPLLAGEAGLFQMATNPSSPISGRVTCVRDRDLGIHSDPIHAFSPSLSHRPSLGNSSPVVTDGEDDDDGIPLDIPELLPGPGDR